MSITKRIAKSLTNYNSRSSIGSRLRAKRVTPLLDMIKSVAVENDRVDIIDVGGEKKYWNIVPYELLQKYNVKITIVNLPGRGLPDNDKHFTFLHANGCDLSLFEDNSFHIAHSNSVIEHVGDWRQMTLFAKEFKRVAKRYFIQTPNYWFLIEPHCMTPFIHWLPKPARIWLVMTFPLGNWRKATSVDMAVKMVESSRLLSRKMFKELFNDAEIITERMFLLPKSHIGIRK